MDRLLPAAFLASIVVHVAAVAALHPRQPGTEPMPVLAASLRAAAVAPSAIPPAAPLPRLMPAAPAAAPRSVQRPATAVLAVAAPAPVSAPAVAATMPETVAPAAAPAVAVAAPVAVLELPRYDAAYLANPPPPYPASARRRGIEGTATVEARVGPGGEARELKLAASAGDAALDAAALEAVRGWRFVPARRGEQAVEAWVRIPLVFRLN